MNWPKIMTHLWFDKEAAQASAFYLSVFPNSRLISKTTIPDTPSGDVESLTIAVEDAFLVLLSAGPYFDFNPTVSFLVSCDTEAEARTYWAALSTGGQILMPLGNYEFAPTYGWLKDQFGVSWQIMYTGSKRVTAKIRPALMFVGDNYRRAEEAIGYYTDVFPNSTVHSIARYGSGFSPNHPESVKFAEFDLEGTGFALMENAFEHEFSFNEAVSFMIVCDSQAEIDHYWDRLSSLPAAEQCGWLKDRFGVSWQVSPKALQIMLHEAGPQALARVTQAFLKMKKFNIAELESAYRDQQ